jgi:hypothetical protein
MSLDGVNQACIVKTGFAQAKVVSSSEKYFAYGYFPYAYFLYIFVGMILSG